MASKYLSTYVSQEQFRLFHSIDRMLYTILVTILCRDPVESLQVMALWLWLERMGFYHAVMKILTLPCTLINQLADETVTCLNVIINGNQFSILDERESLDISLVQTFIHKDISIHYLHENRQDAASGVASATSDVCLRALEDIMQEAIERNAAQTSSSPSSSASSSTHQPHPLLACPAGGLNSPTRVGVIGGGRDNNNNNNNNNNNSNFQQQQQQQQQPPPDRTLFVTFSRGYPVHDYELRHFFTDIYGDCIESLQMQEVQRPEQPLFARVIFYSAAYVESILDGTSKAKFTIRGKHAWARKFVPKRTRSLLPPVLLLQPVLAPSAQINYLES